LTLLQHRVLNGWPLFYLIALLTLNGMVAGMLIIGISSPEATVKLIRLSVQFASPWIYIAFVTSALTPLFPNTFTKWLWRNRRYTGLSFAAGFGWQAVFIAVLLTLYPAHYWDDIHKASDLLGRSLSYIFLLALTITSFLSVRRKMSRAQWHWLQLIGIWYFWAAIGLSDADQALSQNAKTIDVVFALLGLLVLILRLAANINSRGIIAARKSA